MIFLLYILKHNGEWVAMEYGTTEGEEFHFTNCPLVRDSSRRGNVYCRSMDPKKLVEVTLILKQVTQNHRQQGFGNFDNSLILSLEITEQVTKDMGKFVPTLLGYKQNK